MRNRSVRGRGAGSRGGRRTTLGFRTRWRRPGVAVWVLEPCVAVGDHRGKVGGHFRRSTQSQPLGDDRPGHGDVGVAFRTVGVVEGSGAVVALDDDPRPASVTGFPPDEAGLLEDPELFAYPVAFEPARGVRDHP